MCDMIVLQYVAVRCSVLQCGVVCCSVLLQCVAVCCSVLQGIAVCCSVYVCSRTFIMNHSLRFCLNTLQHTHVTHVNHLIDMRDKNVLQYIAEYCSVLQCVAVCCSIYVFLHFHCGRHHHPLTSRLIDMCNVSVL